VYDADGVPPGGVTTPEPTDPPAPTDPPDPDDPPAPEPDDDDDGKPTVPVAAVKAERVKRQAAEAAASKMREENAYLRGQMEATHRQAPAPAAPAAPAAPQAPVAPDINDFDDLDAFNTADRKYLIDQAKYELKQESAQERQQEQRQMTVAQQTKQFQDRLAEEAKLDPDLVTIASTFHIPGHPNFIPILATSREVQDAVRESEVGPQLLRYFANNKVQAAKLATMSPMSAVREIGKIEASIINKPAPPARHVSQAPAPVKPLGQSGSLETDDDELPMSEYLAREKAKRLSGRQKR